MQYASFFAVWLLSSLILGVVHGPTMGTFLGLAIAIGYLVAVRAPAAVAGRDSSTPNTHLYKQHGRRRPTTNG
jgi:hypothetical protein